MARARKSTVATGGTPAGWYRDPYSLATLRWWNGVRWTGASAGWDGESWRLGDDREVAASYTHAAAAARRARRPITVWLWVVVVFALLGLVPTLWAQQDFPVPQPGRACSEEPWHVDPAGMRAWWIWWGILVLLVAGVYLLLSGTRHGLRSDRRVRAMLIACVLIATLVPPVGWAASYMTFVMNCGL